MLSSIDRKFIFTLINNLTKHNTKILISTIIHITKQNPNYAKILTKLINILHHLTITQLTPNTINNNNDNHKQILKYTKHFTPKKLQLYYQTKLLNRHNLPLTPKTHNNFKITLLHIILFKPQNLISTPNTHSKTSNQKTTPPKKPLNPITTKQPDKIPTHPSNNTNNHLSKIKQILKNAKPSPKITKKKPTITPITTKPQQPIPHKKNKIKNPNFKNTQTNTPPQPNTTNQNTNHNTPKNKTNNNNKPQTNPITKPKPKIKTNIIQLNNK